jgi:hypothetical protein
VTVESLDGQVLAARDEPRAAFAGHTDSTRWDEQGSWASRSPRSHAARKSAISP